MLQNEQTLRDLQHFDPSRSSLDTVITRIYSPVPAVTISQDAQTPQTPRLDPIERTPIQAHFDLFALESSPEERLWSHHTMFNHEAQRRLQAQDARINDERIRHDRFRFLLTVAASHIKKVENLRCDELSRLAQVPEVEMDAWLGQAYHESPRPLSMDAVGWTDWTTPACPWTPWKASWNEWGIHVTLPTKPTKTSFPRRMKERLLEKFQQKPSLQRPKTPHYVSAFRRALPLRRPRPPVCKSPTPQQGGFIEHLEENLRYQKMLNNDSGKSVAHAKKSIDALVTEALIDAQNAADSTDKAKISIDKKDVPKGCKDMRNNAIDEEHRKRNIVVVLIKLLFCSEQSSPRLKNRLSKARLERAGEEEQLLEKKGG